MTVSIVHAIVIVIHNEMGEQKFLLRLYPVPLELCEYSRS